MKLPHVIAAVGLLAASLAHAQDVQVDANGRVKIDTADTRVEVDGGSANVATRPGVQTRTQNIGSNVGNTHISGTNIQRVDVRGARVNVGADGRTKITTPPPPRITPRAPTASAGYVNGALDGSNFSGRNLTGVAFVNASLNRAQFINAILIAADFTNARLNDADLRGANLRNAQIDNAQFGKAKLEGATWVDGRKCGKGSIGVCR